MGPAFDKARAKCDEQFLRGPETELHVIGAGLPRTGTTSLAAALEMLYPGLPCHQMEVAALQPEQCEQWLALDAALREGGVSQTDAAPALRALVRNHAAAVDVHKATPHFKVWSDFKESGGVVSQVSAKYDAIDFTE